MSRKKGPDKLKLELILYALRASPHGCWVREIARRTGMRKSTVSHYVKNHLAEKIDVLHESNHIKIVKLKEQVLWDGVPSYIR